MSTKKTPSLAAPLDAQEIKYRTPKSRTKERSVHEMELAEVAHNAYYRSFFGDELCGFDNNPAEQTAWRNVARSVLEEAIYRVEAKIK